MYRHRATHIARYFCSFLLPLLLQQTLCAQVTVRAEKTIKHRINENQRTRIESVLRPELQNGNDEGSVNQDTRFDHILLQLRRPAQQQRALDQYLNELNDPTSGNYHKWLTAQEFGSRFGMAPGDLENILQWLRGKGITVHGVTPNLAVDLSASALQLQQAFHMRVHHVSVHGKSHTANIDAPEIPAALAPAIAGFVSLSDFKPVTLSHAVQTTPAAEFTTAAGAFPLVPADLNTIYNFSPAFESGISGQGQTIAVIEDSDMANPADWNVFRKVFGLARPHPLGNLVTFHPSSSSGQSCVDPGVNTNADEATLDAEWASAAAPDATIVVASCQGTAFTYGIFVALQNLLTNGELPPPIISISFGLSEAFIGAGQNAFISSLYQLAAAEGVSIFVASGDSGGADYDAGNSPAMRGLAVNGFSSTPYNVSVGGTDFADKYLGSTAQFWRQANSPVFGSAASYIPEIPWNSSCGSTLLAAYKGFNTTYGAAGYCNNGGVTGVVASGGGASNCAFGFPGPGGVAGSTCSGYPKPAWQTVIGNPQDGVRDVPDVALFASNNVWGHYYVVCYSALALGGKSCLGDPATWNGFGGTSVAAPIMAGVQALLNQASGTRAGNPNPLYYAIASSDYGSTGNAGCDASQGVTGVCAFHDVTLGDSDVACVSPNNCFVGDSPTGTGVLSLSNSSYLPTYPANVGWDFATGLGSIDVSRLVEKWSLLSLPSSSSSGSFTQY